MQKGMPYPWFMCFRLSAAIALPSATLLWLPMTASASESTALAASQAASLAAESAQNSDRPQETPAIVSMPEQVAVTPTFSASPQISEFATPADTDVAKLAVAKPSEQPLVTPALPRSLTTITTAQSDSVPIVAETLPPVTASTILPTVEAPQFEAYFSQADPEPLDDTSEPALPSLDEPSEPLEDENEPELPALEEPEDVLEEEDEPSGELEGVDEPEGVLEENSPIETLEESESEEILEDLEEGEGSGEILEELEETEDSSEILDDLEATEDPEPVIEEDEGVFSPLPDSETDQELEEDLEELGEPVPDELLPEDPSLPPTDAVVPIPADQVLDELEYLDPNPNPLLIPTQPEEVEIIGTQPLSLEEAVELAYRNNPDLRVAFLELEQSQAALREARADYYPSVSVNSTLQGQNTTSPGSTELVPTPDGGLSFESNTSEELGASLSAQVDVVYNLYSSGLRESSVRAAEEQVQLAELEVERRQAELRLATANEYYDLQAAIEAIRISQAFLEEAERNLRDTVLREEVGVGTRFDVLRAEVQVANARQDLVNSQRARQVAQRTLARRLNVPPSVAITTVPVEIAGVWPLELEESIVLAFQNRAELEQQLVQREVNEELRQAELAALGPQVDLFANYSISDILTQEGSFEDNYSFGARLSWTLYDGGAAQARARQREVDIEIAERNFEEARNTIRLGVESAYYNLVSNRTNIDTARLAVEQAQEALDLAILRFDAGVGTQLDILNAQSELTDAEVNLVQAIVGYNRSLAELNRAVSNLPEPYYETLPY